MMRAVTGGSGLLQPRLLLARDCWKERKRSIYLRGVITAKTPDQSVDRRVFEHHRGPDLDAQAGRQGGGEVHGAHRVQARPPEGGTAGASRAAALPDPVNHPPRPGNLQGRTTHSTHFRHSRTHSLRSLTR